VTGTVPRGDRTVANIFRSLVPLVALVLVAVWLWWPEAGSRVHVIDPGGDLRAASQFAPYRVVSAQGLPPGWRPTSSRLDRPTSAVVTVQVGYLSPAGRYARYVQSNLRTDDLLNAQIPGAAPDGTVAVGGRPWQRYRTGSGETALVLPGAVTLLVTGSAGPDELSALAASLH
jgi:hypothetical protein